MQNKITPCLWYSAHGGKIAELVAYYKDIFKENLKEGNIMPIGETPSGYTEMCEIEIFGQRYSLMCTEKPHNEMNDSFALMIDCDGQEEIDMYWDYFTKEGRESQCGWCVDKYGLRWQIIPSNLGALMSRPNSWEVMMKQKKIVIAEYLK
jgi:predicted 3-demethylubiquinone-9 3-methyltransferase (glyoxalase superfamily)